MIVYHYPICPFSRQVRIYLSELGIEFTLVKEDYWQSKSNVRKLNPAGVLPIIQINDNIYSGIYAITEYIYDSYDHFIFMHESKEIKAEIRRLIAWANDKFYNEVTKVFINEKVIRPFSNIGTPRVEYLKAMSQNLHKHLEYFTSVLEERSFLAYDSISCADIACSTHLSVLDYFGEINWDKYLIVKQWYSIIKSRPSFRSLLNDQVPGFTAHKSYKNLDF